MNLQLIKLNTDSKDIEYFEQINEEAFPVSERTNFDEFFAFASDANADVIGIYDDTKPVGFTFVVKNQECGYIFYLAIDRQARSKGYGSAVLQKLREFYSELQLILDFEEIDETAENIAQRIRRKNFYLRNGFHETGNYTIMLEDLRFEVVCTDGELQKEAFVDLIHIIHKHCAAFLDILL